MSEVVPACFESAANPHVRDLGSAYDAVLHGVAGKLADLFPPIHNSQRSEIETRDQVRDEAREEVVA
ncbi:hypothetical protein [Methylorubrum sp. SB2]|uniref:hypothetical protein n=1 Tax=Methylorubrum subtropicum TaxID=3138812 RepID=UPI00313AF0AA